MCTSMNWNAMAFEGGVYYQFRWPEEYRQWKQCKQICDNRDGYLNAIKILLLMWYVSYENHCISSTRF